MIKINSVSKMYKNKVYQDFCLEILENQVTALIASSGAGKTTLLNIIAGLTKPDSGEIIFYEDGKRLEERPAISYVFQESTLLPWYSARKNIEIVLENQFTKSECKDRAEFYLEKVGLKNQMNSLPCQLSGGEKQRVSIARSFAFPSKILLMDEAFQSQDVRTKINLMELFENMIREEPKTVVFVTHDIREAFCLSDRIIVMEGVPLFIKKEIFNDRNKICGENPLSMKERYVSPCKNAIETELEIF